MKRGTNKDIGPKDIFEMGSNYHPMSCFNFILKTAKTKRGKIICRLIRLGWMMSL